MVELYSQNYIIINQDEGIFFNNDSKFYSWDPRGENETIYFGEYNKYIKYTVYAVVTSEWDLLYMITDGKTTETSFNTFSRKF